MDFSRHQQAAARTSARLRVAYGFAIVAVVVAFDAAAWLAWRGLFGDAAPPVGFLLINTLATAGLIVGGTLVERQRLVDDATALPERLGARPLGVGARLSFADQRAINVTEEVALAARHPIPRLFVLEHDHSINALATGVAREDAAIVLTRGAIDRLDRDELQGVVAHEIAHLASGDVAVDTLLASMNYGLELVANAGRRAVDAALGRGQDDRRRSGLRAVYLVPGLLLMAVGSAGHLAARMLAAAIGRQREHHADALAVRLTRTPIGLGNALRKIVWLSGRDLVMVRGPMAEAGLDHALFHLDPPRAFGGRFATHPPIAERIARLLGDVVPTLAAVRQGDGMASVAQDAWWSAAAIERTALPALAFDGDGDGVGDGDGDLALPDSDPAAPSPARRHLAMLLASAQQMHGAAALTALLILDRGVEAEVWPQRWAVAFERQAAIAERLRALGPASVERLRWPLLEVCASTLRPMALPWRDDLLRMLRGQIELDQRVTLGEWIYYMLLRTRIVAAHGVAWRGDERDANPAQAVRWVVTVLGQVAGEPALRGERAAHEIIRALGLPRTGQTHPPLDVGGLQSAVASLRQIPMLQRPLLMRRLVAFLPEDAPIEGRDFLRVLALIIDCPPPVFTPLRLSTPDTIGMPTERSLPVVDRAAAGPETVAMPGRFADTVAFPPTVAYAPPATGRADVPRAAATPALVD